MRVGSLFSGFDGLGLGLQMVFPQAKPAWFVEIDPAPSKVLQHWWPETPNLGDITQIDWATVPPIDILTGGFPCQDVSHAGLRKGMKPGTRSGLWEHFAYAIDALQPKVVIIENVRGLLSARTGDSHEVVRVGPKGGRKVEHTRRALGRVLWDLADLGYDAQWIGIRASDAGAPHGRFRVWITAQPATYAGGGRREDGEAPQAGQPVVGDGGAGGVKLLPTPVATDANGSGSRNTEGSKAHAGVSLTDAILVGDSTTGRQQRGLQAADFGVYSPAVARWEAVLGRPAPSPTTPGREGRPRLNPVFVEWMMGLPEGHVTSPEIGLSRADILKALGNGVVPIQAAVAISHMALGTPITATAIADLLPTPAVNDDAVRALLDERSAEPDEYGCRLWTGWTNEASTPYGKFSLGNVKVYAHRAAYELAYGPIPAGYEIDHLCQQSLCITPEHLEAVTPSVNRGRVAERRTHCKWGHEFTEENTYWVRPGARACRKCRARIDLAQKQKARGEIPLLPTPACNDMGEGKTVEDWDAWTVRMKAEHRNGNGHGKSLAIEAQRLAFTHARTEGDDMIDPTAPKRDLVAELEECIGELPVEVADLFNSALNDQIELSNAGLRAWLDDFLAEQEAV